MPGKVVVRDGESLKSAMCRFRRIVRENGVLTGSYIRMSDRNCQKYFYEKPGVKRRRRRHIANKNRRGYQFCRNPHG